MRLLFFLFALLLTSCTAKTAIPMEFPTPPPPAFATPLPELNLRRDSELEKIFAAIATDAKGKVGAAAVILETGEAAILNDELFPMQSVYKLPIAMAVVEQARLDKLDLDEKIGVTMDDFVRQGQASVLRDKNPNGGEFTIRELIRFALVESDGTASDVLLRVLGGPDEAQLFLAKSFTGVGKLMSVANTEKEIGQDWETQYKNTASPGSAVDVLRFLAARSIPVESGGKPEDAGAALILQDIKDSVTGPNRIKGLLPKDTVVAHKTGTGGTRNGITSATNDIGIVYLPNGKHLAVAVFVSDSPADEKTRESVIARIAKAAWDKWSK